MTKGRTKYHPHANDNRPAWFDALLLQYEPFIRGRARNEETYQEAICRALENWYRFRPDGHFPTWLNYIVRLVRHETLVRQTQESNAQIPTRVQDPTQEFQAEAHRITKDLSPLRLEMVAMIAQGYTFVEIAAAQGVSTQAVEERARRVWESMRAANDNVKKDKKAA